MIRSLLEKISRNRVLTRTLSTSRGPRRISVTPESGLRYWLPYSANSDRSLLNAADHFISEGASVWDIGANIGVFTFCAAANAGSTGRVLSLDADPFLTSLILRTVSRLPQQDAAVTVVTAAVSDNLGTAELVIPVRSRASSHLRESPGCTQTGGRRHSFKTLCVTLDFLLETTFRPSFVKMDIEGMELVALKKSPRLLSEARPTFHLEVWDEIADQLTELFVQNEYELFDFESDPTLSKPLTRATWCTLARPK
jgi:FkbM family methyltransferase